MFAVALPMFGFPLGEDVVLVPRTAALSDAYHDLLAANHERLARWEPWAAGAVGGYSRGGCLGSGERGEPSGAKISGRPAPAARQCQAAAAAG